MNQSVSAFVAACHTFIIVITRSQTDYVELKTINDLPYGIGHRCLSIHAGAVAVLLEKPMLLGGQSDVDLRDLR